MKITAVICEYNPMTNGHTRHLELARQETAADTIVCVMSGSFTQRGDACLIGKYLRAKTACMLGADMVVELPLIYAVSPADNFAYGAVKIISSFPCVDYISFGSECGDISLLSKAAEFIMNEPPEVSADIKLLLKEGYTVVKARAIAIDKYVANNDKFSDINSILDSPNNVLAIAYICAAKILNFNVKFHTIKRLGGGYNQIDTETSFPSASAVRQAVAKEKLGSIETAVHPFVLNLLKECKKSSTTLGDLILFKVKNIDGYQFEKYYDVTGGIHNRIKLAAINSLTYESLLENSKTKSITLARLKRICVYALFDITKQMYETAKELPPYIFVLAMRKERKDILSELSKTTTNLLVRYSDINKVDKRLKFLIKLDFTAQGTLEIINKSGGDYRKMILV